MMLLSVRNNDSVVESKFCRNTSGSMLLLLAMLTNLPVQATGFTQVPPTADQPLEGRHLVSERCSVSNCAQYAICAGIGVR